MGVQIYVWQTVSVSYYAQHSHLGDLGIFFSNPSDGIEKKMLFQCGTIETSY